MSLCDLRWVATEVTISQNRQNEEPPAARDDGDRGDDVPAAANGANGDDRRTREVGIRELKHRTSEVIDRVTWGERVAVTRRGRIVGVILSLDESLEFVLGYAKEFTQARAEALEGIEAGE
jgi:prevent-host-death family protein